MYIYQCSESGVRILMCLGLPDPHPDPLVRGKDPPPDPHPDPYQNVTDPQHWLAVM